MRKTLSAFTIVELILVISIIGVLSTIGVVSYSSIHTSAIDSNRESKAKAIAEALEKYYEKNGEYPSCTAMTQSASTVTSTILTDLTNDMLTTPGDAEGTNSITCDELTGISLDKFSYTGDSNAECDTGDACLYFTIGYIQKNSEEVATINSRHTADYVIADVSDNFNRTASSLGTTSTGGLAWTANPATWSTNGTKAVTSTTGSSNPTATVTYSYADVNASTDISSTGSGDALIIRATDANNYIRARYYHYYTTTSGSCYIGSWVYQYQVYTEGTAPGVVIPSSKVGGYCIPYDDFPGINGSGVAQYKTVVTSTPTSWCDYPYTLNEDCWWGNKYNRTVYEILPENTYYYYVKIEVISGGAVSQTLYSSNYGSAISNLRLKASGSSIALYLNGSTSPTTTVTSTFNQTATKHGIGRADPGAQYTTSALDNFTLAQP